MKKKLILISLLFGVSFVVADLARVSPLDTAGKRVDPGSVHTARPVWTVLDTTSSDSDEPTDLAVTERTYQTVKAAIGTGASGDAEISIFDVPRSWNAIRLRAIGITDAGTYTVEIYLGTLGDGNRDVDSTAADCELAYAGQLAWVVGTQVSTTSTYEMADAVTITSSDWAKDWNSASPSGNRVAEATIDLMGADVVVIVPTVASADSKLLGRGF